MFTAFMFAHVIYYVLISREVCHSWPLHINSSRNYLWKLTLMNNCTNVECEPTNYDRPFHNFRASRAGDRLINIVYKCPAKDFKTPKLWKGRLGQVGEGAEPCILSIIVMNVIYVRMYIATIFSWEMPDGTCLKLRASIHELYVLQKRWSMSLRVLKFRHVSSG